MSLGRLLRNRWVLALGGVALAAYCASLAGILWWLSRRAPGRDLGPRAAAYVDGRPVLSLDRQGAVLAPGRNQALAASEVPRWLQELLRHDRPQAAPPGPPLLIVRAPREVPCRRVYEVLRLCQAVGFDGLELRTGESAGVVVRLPSSGRPGRPQDPDWPGDEDLALAAQLTIQIQRTETSEVLLITVSTPEGGPVLVPDTTALGSYLNMAALSVDPRDGVCIIGEGSLPYGVLTDVLAVCRRSGFTNLHLAPPPEPRPKRRSDLD